MPHARLSLAVAFAVLIAPVAQAAEKTSVTIYSTATPGSISPDMYRPMPGGQGGGWMYGNQIPGYAMVHQQREVDLKAGMNDVKFTDVAAYIDPTTVSFKSLTDPATMVVEQDYHFDLVSGQKLLERYLDQEITVDQAGANGAVTSTTGKLLSASGGLVLQGKDGKVTSVNNYSNIHFPELPGGLITKPTLMWSVDTQKPGKHQIDTGYQTSGITWWADYNATYKEGKDENSGVLDLGAWVSIINKSGASYDNAGLKLVAGDVHRAEVKAGMQMAYRTDAMALAAPAAAPGFAEKAFFEFHLYTLGRATSIPADSTKQIELFPQVTKIPVEKQYFYNGSPMQSYGGGVYMERFNGLPVNKKVDVFLKFKNEKKVGMGMPLPAGRLRVSKLDDADGSLEFIGEDTIDHTPKDEDVKIKLGDAFDITGDRKQTDFHIDMNNHVMEETYEIALSNHKNGDVTVMVTEAMFRAANWEITKADGKYDKLNSNTVQFPVTVKKDETAKLHYTVRYSW